jgi:hypothetical protein
MTELVDRQRSLAVEHQCAATRRTEPPYRRGRRLGPLHHNIGIARGDNVGAWSSPNQNARDGSADGDSSTAPMPEAIAVSASATKIPPSDKVMHRGYRGRRNVAEWHLANIPIERGNVGS